MLTHEQVVDILWKDGIQPVLLRRFPDSTPEQLRKAHAYAYGGCLIQDMGYYPFANRLFTDLVHCVRTGDFVENLIRQSTNLNEYAFALGALAHYSSDNCGHPVINHVVALTFPKLRAKFGDQVTFANNPKAHIRTEFGFDMVQVAKNRYTSDRYHDFIGFEVSKPVLERAFFETYDLKIGEVLGRVDLAIGTFRRSVSQVLPKMTQVALATHHAEIVKDTPNFHKKNFLYNLSRSEYEKEWGKDYRRPGILARIMATILRWIPKIGPLKALDFKIPDTQSEDLYIKSVNQTVENYGGLLRAVESGHFHLPNMNCDTGAKPQSGEYPLADETYARLLDELAKRGCDRVDPDLRKNILLFYGNLDGPNATRKDQKRWRRIVKQLEELKLRSPRDTASRPAR